MLKILKRMGAKEWLSICIGTVLIVVQVWLDLLVPDYMAEITRLVTMPGGTVREVMYEGMMMLLLTLASVGTSVLVGFLASKVGAGFSQRLRGDVFRRVQSFSMEEMNEFTTASLITRTTNDITQIQMIVAMGLQVAIRAPIMAAWALGKISMKNWEWTAFTGGLVAVVVIMITALMIYALPKFQRIQTLTDSLNRVTRENLTGIRVVRAFNAEGYQEAKFREANDEFTANNLSVNRAMQLMNPVMRMVMSGLSLGIFWIGAHLINAAALSAKGDIFADMVVFSQYAMHVIMSFMLLTMIFVMLPRVMVSVRRVNEVLDKQPAIRDSGRQSAAGEAVMIAGGEATGEAGVAAGSEATGEAVREATGEATGEAGKDHSPGVQDAPSYEASPGDVEFINVSFKYPDAEDYVLRNVSFKAGCGETVAFIGSTGSGKSTIVNLIPRFYDATEGRVLVGGTDVRDYKLETLRNKLGYVPQRAVLFMGTATSNIAFGDSGKPKPGEDEVKAAARIAQVSEFIESMDEGYESQIAQGGTNVSGGQKQRIAIARAVCRKPEIFIFDDSFSALDYKTDRELRAALRRETGGATNLIVAQRIGTIREADRIIVLDEGAVVGMGKHEDLMKTCSVYQEIAYSQLSEEELGVSAIRTEEANKNKNFVPSSTDN